MGSSLSVTLISWGVIYRGDGGQHAFKLVVQTGASENFPHRLTDDVAFSSLGLCSVPPAGGASGQKPFHSFIQPLFIEHPLCGGLHAEA